MTLDKPSDRISELSTQHNIDSTKPPGSPLPKWSIWWLFLCLLLILQRTVDAPNLWWDLSRGRAVVEGTVAPSQTLLALDHHAEADWIGGVPFYILWGVLGLHGLAVIPILSGSTLIVGLNRCLKTHNELYLFILLPLLAWGVRDHLQPIPELFDLYGLLILAAILARQLSSRTFWSLGILFAIWANLATGFVWGVLWIMGTMLANMPKKQHGLGFACLLAAILGATFTPRGFLGWRDAVIIHAPSAFADLSPFALDHWQPAWLVWPVSPSEMALLIIFGGTVWVVLRSCRWVPSDGGKVHSISSLVYFSYMLVVPLLGCLLSRNNVPVFCLWLVLMSAQMMTDENRTVQKLWLAWPRTCKWLVACLILLLAVVDASGNVSSSSSRLSWGIASAIDHRTLTLPTVRLAFSPVIGWTPDELSAGVIAWRNEGYQIADHPQRALLAGRLPEHASLQYDLQNGHRARYRRQDGTWGGWVRKTSEWNIDCLFLPIRMMELNRSLLTSTWRPIDLDSPIVPYAQPQNQTFSGPILETISQQGFVEIGNWQPGLELYNSYGWRTDLIEVLTGRPDPGPVIRQSQIFRAMDLPIASLRTLHPLRRLTNSRHLQDEFEASLQAVGYQEWSTFGEASLLRKLAAGTDWNSSHRWSTLSHRSVNLVEWMNLLKHYSKSNLQLAIKASDPELPQQRYAIAMFLLEAGESEGSAQILQSLRNSSDSELRIAANYWHERLVGSSNEVNK